MQDTIFREYDIRGKVGSEFDINQTYDLTRAIACYLKEQDPSIEAIAVAMDGRLSSPLIKDFMIQALRDGGLNVFFIGVCPSPVLYFSLYQLPVQAGLMITASHNPKEYNGIKISLGTKTVWGQQIKEIGNYYRTKKFLPMVNKGWIKEYFLHDDYINWLFNHFPSLVAMPLSVVIDCGNATGGTILPQLIKKMQWDAVQLLYPEVDGNYPNHEPDPTVAANMAHVKMLLSETTTQVGIGLDGDCDRVAAMTKSGFLIPGDQLLAVFAQDILKKNVGSSIVMDIKASLGLIELVQEWKAQPIMAPCGHAIIKEYMEKHKALIGGELSCHFFFNDRHFGYDDGIYAMMRLFEIITMSGQSLEELISIFPKKYSSPEIRLECSEEKKPIIIEFLKKEFASKKDLGLLTLDGIRVTYPNGWANVRSSNTQSVLSMRFEADSLKNLDHIKNDFIELLTSYFDKQVLMKTILHTEYSI